MCGENAWSGRSASAPQPRESIVSTSNPNYISELLKSLFKNKCLFQADEFLGKFHLSRRSIVGYVTETKMEFHKNTSEMR